MRARNRLLAFTSRCRQTERPWSFCTAQERSRRSRRLSAPGYGRRSAGLRQKRRSKKRQPIRHDKTRFASSFHLSLLASLLWGLEQRGSPPQRNPASLIFEHRPFQQNDTEDRRSGGYTISALRSRFC